MQDLMKDMVMKAFSAYNMQHHGADNNVASPAYPVKDWRMARLLDQVLVHKCMCVIAKAPQNA